MIAGLLDFEPVLERRDGVRSYVSPSRLSLWMKCPLAFAFHYLDGLRSPTTPSMFLGKVVHSGLATQNRHRQLGIAMEADDVIERMMDSWGQLVDEEQMVFESTDVERALRQQAAALVMAYLKQVPDDEPRPLAVEIPVEAPLIDPLTDEDLGIPLYGIMDLVLDAPAGPIIADYKTTARSSEPMEITHEIQLTSYAYLLRRTHDRAEAGLEIRSLVKTKTPKIETHRYPARTDRHFRRFFTVVREYLDAVDSGRFSYRPGFGCGMCDFRDGPCRAWAG